MKKDIDKKLHYRQVKPTAMRELVLDILLEEKAALSLSDLEAKFDNVDKSTLYRTLKTFEEKKVIHSIDDGSGAVKYAICIDSCQCSPNDLHVHFHCIKCKKTYCLRDIPVPTVNIPNGFSLKSIDMVIKGICPNCSK